MQEAFPGNGKGENKQGEQLFPLPFESPESANGFIRRIRN